MKREVSKKKTDDKKEDKKKADDKKESQSQNSKKKKKKIEIVVTEMQRSKFKSEDIGHIEVQVSQTCKMHKSNQMSYLQKCIY